MSGIITLLLVGVSVGLGNFAASVAIGLGGVSKSLRLRIAIVFGLFETVMPIIGLVIGQQVAHELGGHANLIGGLLLGLTGLYLLLSGLKKGNKKSKQTTNSWGKLILTGLSLSIDNLIIGFGLGTRHQPMLLAIIVIGTTCIAMSLIGLELGNKLNKRVEEYSEAMSGLILILVGILVAVNLL